VKDPVIQYYNLKSKSKPFMIVMPGTARFGLICPLNDWPWSLYRWNHFPVGQLPSDGRQVFGIDGRPLSSCVTQTRLDKKHPANLLTDKSLTMYFMFGMTMDKSAGELAPLARSWSMPPELKLKGESFINHGYSVAERCYTLENKSGNPNESLDFILKANGESPVVNPAFVIKNYNAPEIEVRINGKIITGGKALRKGSRQHLDGTSDRIIWMQYESQQPVHFQLSAKQEKHSQ
jgi:hypothetical protein